MYGSPPVDAATDPGSAARAALEELEAAAEEDTTRTGGIAPRSDLPELLNGLLEAWNMVAAIKAPRWHFNGDESRALVAAWTPVAEKYGADVALAPELVALAVTLAVVAPRLQRGTVEVEAEAAGDGAYRIQ